MHAPRDLRPRGRSIRTPCPDQVGRKRERFRLGQVFGLVDTLRDVPCPPTVAGQLRLPDRDSLPNIFIFEYRDILTSERRIGGVEGRINDPCQFCAGPASSMACRSGALVFGSFVEQVDGRRAVHGVKEVHASHGHPGTSGAVPKEAGSHLAAGGKRSVP